MQGTRESRNVVIFCLAHLLSAFGYELWNPEQIWLDGFPMG